MFLEAHAMWRGGPYTGDGSVSTPSGILNKSTYSSGSLSEGAPCTTPCEVLAAALACCMSSMVATEMAKVGIKPVVVDTRAVVNLDNPGGKWQITGAHLEITARTTDAFSERFDDALKAAQNSSPISGALKFVPTCKARLICLTAPAFV
jgi:osmotically inducible protein OsmC